MAGITHVCPPPAGAVPANSLFANPDVEALLRREWWLNHACPVGSWYGDDGEMSCGACRLDFKRMPIEVLYERVTWARVEAAAKAMAELRDGG